MGKASRVLLVLFRIWQVICSVIVLAILARFLHLLSEAGAWRDGRIVYGIIAASISLVFALVFIAPFMYAFMAFPFDFVLFIMWLVLFCLLITRTGTATCSSPWFYNYWGYYWGGWWRRPFFGLDGPADIAYSGCAHWRTALAFAFMAMFAYLITAIMGAIVVSKYWSKKGTDRRAGTGATTGVTGYPQTSQVEGTGHHTGGVTHTGGVLGTNAPGPAPATTTTTTGQSGSYV